jgi:hypothetical protein
MTASQSPISAQRTAAVLTESLPNATIARFDGVGHMAPVLAPDRVNERIVRHVEGASVIARSA